MADDFNLDDILDDALNDFEEEEHQHQTTAQSSSSSSRPTQLDGQRQEQDQFSSFVSSMTASSAETAQSSSASSASIEGGADVNRIMDALQQLNMGGAPSSESAGAMGGEMAASGGDEDTDMEKILADMSEEEKQMFDKFTTQMQGFFEQMQNVDEQQQQPAAGSASAEGGRSSSDGSAATLDDTIKQTLDMLDKGSKEFDPNTAMDDDDAVKNLMKMFGDMAGGNASAGASGSSSSSNSGAAGAGESGGEQSEEQVYGFLENIMKALMSPDVLEEPMKHLAQKYPVWLEDNKGRVSSDEYDRVQKQYEYTKRIINVYATQHFPDSLPTLIDLMKDMQACGQPPEEIIEELNAEGGKNPLSNMEGMPKDCSIM